MNDEPIRIHVPSQYLDDLLAQFRDLLGPDYDGYRNHLYRVLTYTLNFVVVDPPQRQVIETALVFHDIGLWTDRELAYLQPSVARALQADVEHGWGLDTRLLSDLILAHHKLTAFVGPDADLVNAFRRADWIDASGGKRRMGLSKAQVDAVNVALPDAGFAATLARIIPELGGSKLRGYAQVLRHVYRW